jgi:hypothetical protein
MHQLTVVFGDNGGSWAFQYKDANGAITAVQTIMDAMVHKTLGPFARIADDFSQVAYINTDEIVGWLSEDCEISKIGQIERGLHQARVQAKAQELAGQDPLLRQARIANQRSGPVLSPMSNGGF